MSKIIGTNALMKHLRVKHNVKIKGSSHKQKLRTFGYYHGYKGYRFIRTSTNKITFTSFDEIIAFNQFDLELKTLFYPSIMFIETALKNYVLEELLKEARSNSFESIFDENLNYYKTFSSSDSKYKKELQKKLRLRNQIYSVLSREYSNERKIVKHYYHSNKTLPIWAIFESISMGEFGTFTSCLDKTIKQSLSLSIGLNQSCDTDARLTEKIIFQLKDLRNAIAHNDVIFDTRFKNSSASNELKQCLMFDTGISDITFNTLTDYFILVIYLSKLFKVSKTELTRSINQFDSIINTFRTKVPISVFHRIFETNSKRKISSLRLYL
ncbi:Abi family protein [Fusibacter tunisiensis]|uniref:Abortive infection bacteriophage resistance protein n=1 Tax=Fusibacter tunisiensis TaxID=1008308 RepID=A0ABS2MTN2_9FIRM|nr:Abi family protein [Fusibacter tunisiensis]MBM7562763.1 abortive infection bacteriophage resistance protein [Fusibacter tunisiensis]